MGRGAAAGGNDFNPSPQTATFDRIPNYRCGRYTARLAPRFQSTTPKEARDHPLPHPELVEGAGEVAVSSGLTRGPADRRERGLEPRRAGEEGRSAAPSRCAENSPPSARSCAERTRGHVAANNIADALGGRLIDMDELVLLAPLGRFWDLFKPHQQVLRVDLIARLDQNLRHFPISIGVERRLHLHRLDGQKHVARPDLLAGRD